MFTQEQKNLDFNLKWFSCLVLILQNKITTELHKTANKIFCSDVKKKTLFKNEIDWHSCQYHILLTKNKNKMRLHLHRNRIHPEGANCSWLTNRLPALCEVQEHSPLCVCVCVSERAGLLCAMLISENQAPSCTIIRRTSRLVGGTERHRKRIRNTTLSPSVQPLKNTQHSPKGLIFYKENWQHTKMFSSLVELFVCSTIILKQWEAVLKIILQHQLNSKMIYSSFKKKKSSQGLQNWFFQCPQIRMVDI